MTRGWDTATGRAGLAGAPGAAPGRFSDRTVPTCALRSLAESAWLWRSVSNRSELPRVLGVTDFRAFISVRV